MAEQTPQLPAVGAFKPLTAQRLYDNPATWEGVGQGKMTVEGKRALQRAARDFNIEPHPLLFF